MSMSNSTSKKKSDFDLYQVITDKITDSLEKGVVPWNQPWRTVDQPAPMNFISKKAYHGINVLLLGMSGFTSPYWMTVNQANQKGGTIRKGEKATMVVFFKMMKGTKRETDDKGVTTDKSIQFPFLRYYNVFNAEQVEGIEFPQAEERPADFNPIAEADAVLDHFSEELAGGLSYGGNKSYYRPDTDHIQLPERGYFETPESFYSTAFHEAGHATGHETRLKRVGGKQFGDEAYGKEELIAEMTAAFVSAEVGIERIAPSASYIDNWLKAIEGDKMLVVNAGFKAGKAADYILGRIETYESTEEAA
jgi:antirestriction protein ArdC